MVHPAMCGVEEPSVVAASAGPAVPKPTAKMKPLVQTTETRSWLSDRVIHLGRRVIVLKRWRLLNSGPVGRLCRGSPHAPHARPVRSRPELFRDLESESPIPRRV